MINSQVTPLLQREIGSHHPATSVSALLGILQGAEFAYLVSQAELFDDMEERDAHLYSEMNKRKNAVAKLDWRLSPSRLAGAREKKDVANLEDVLRDSIDVETLIYDLASGIGHGFSCVEIEWGRGENGWWLPKALHHRPQRWFTVDRETRRIIRLRSPGKVNGEDLIHNAWIVHQHSAKTGYPATQGLFRVLALPYLFKNFAVKNWLRFLEMYGVPLRILMTQGKDDQQRQELITELLALGSNGAAVLNNILGEDFKTANMTSGEGQGFMSLVEWAEKSMSKAILGGTLSSDTGKNGNYATAKVHDDARLEIREHDAKQIAASLTRDLIGSIVRLNGLSLRARWQFDTQEPEDLALYADALPKLATGGVQIPLSWVSDTLKIPQPQDGEPVMSAAPTPNPAPDQAKPKSGAGLHAILSAGNPEFTAEQQVIEDMADGLNNALNSPVSSDLIASAIRSAKNPQDLERRLAAVLKGADLTEFNSMLEKALFAADVLGYAHAEG